MQTSVNESKTFFLSQKQQLNGLKITNCNDISKYIESKATYLWLNMITDRQDNRAGFRASWEQKKSLNLGGLKFQVALAWQ